MLTVVDSMLCSHFMSKFYTVNLIAFIIRKKYILGNMNDKIHDITILC